MCSQYIGTMWHGIQISWRLQRRRWKKIQQLSLTKTGKVSNVHIFFPFVFMLWGDDIIICIYSYWLFKKCFNENYGISKFHDFLIFYPIYFKVSLFCSKFFTLSNWLNPNLDRISPLRVMHICHLFLSFVCVCCVCICLWVYSRMFTSQQKTPTTLLSPSRDHANSYQATVF